MNPLLNMLCRGENITVDSDENWPRFIILENRQPRVMTAENCDPTGAIIHDGDDTVKTNVFSRMSAFFRWSVTVIKILIKNSGAKN